MAEYMMILFIGIIVYQQVYFGYQVNKLVDKIMSRSFMEYKAAKQMPVKKKETLEFRDTESENQDLRILNSLIGS